MMGPGTPRSEFCGTNTFKPAGVATSQTGGRIAEDAECEHNAMSYFIVSFTPGPGWQQGADVFGQPLDDHVSYLNALYASGAVLMAGPLADGSGGLTILQCASPEEASSLAAHDPAVQQGILAADVKQWRPIAWGFTSGERLPYEGGRLQVARVA
jgi:uncharacterized protein YciI